jgi:hypothetical protein
MGLLADMAVLTDRDQSRALPNPWGVRSTPGTSAEWCSLGRFPSTGPGPGWRLNPAHRPEVRLGPPEAVARPDLPVTDRPEGLGRASVALREGDLFPTALPPEPGTWQPPDPERVATIAGCASTEGLASKHLRREQAKGKVTDHLLAVGQDALVCALTRPP